MLEEEYKKREEKKESRTSGINRKYLVVFNPNLSVIILSANGLNGPIKREIQGLSSCIRRSKHKCMLLTVLHLNFKNKENLKI